MASKISFTKVEVNINLRIFKKVKIWLNLAAEQGNKQIDEISYNFCSDDFLLKMNNQFLKHNYFTDVITFNYSAKNRLMGEIFISVDRVKENAKEYGVTYENELLRVIIHSFLHLCKYNDETEKEKLKMRKKENEYLKIYYAK